MKNNRLSVKFSHWPTLIIEFITEPEKKKSKLKESLKLSFT